MGTFEVDDSSGVFVIKCPERIDGKDPRRLEAEIKLWLLSPVDAYVLDFQNVQSIDPGAYRPQAPSRAFALITPDLVALCI